MLLGALRELGRAPRVVSAGAENVPDLPDALVTRSLSGTLTERVIPALMACGRHFYVGSTLADAHRESPWPQALDWCAPDALAELSALFAAHDVDTQVHAPASVLPSNLVQRILYERYPALYRHQRSVPAGERSEKNLHVALCKLRHGIPFDDHCGDPLLADLVAGFVEQQTARPDHFDFRRCRLVVRREMRAILFAQRDDPRLARVRSKLPGAWHGPWIDYVHPYAAPDLDEGFLRIYREYADAVDAAPSSERLWRVAV